MILSFCFWPVFAYSHSFTPMTGLLSEADTIIFYKTNHPQQSILRNWQFVQINQMERQ